MGDITLVRHGEMQMNEADKAIVRNFVFGTIDGLGDANRKSWRRFWGMLMRLGPGEMVDIKTHKERIGKNHRRHMLMETRVFEAQERIDSFRQFRNWLYVAVGFCDWFAGAKGGVVPIPKSISYASLEELEMQKLHDDIVIFLRTEHAVRFLWPKLPDQQRDAAMDALLSEFHE